jgi:hypothetical protein
MKKIYSVIIVAAAFMISCTKGGSYEGVSGNAYQVMAAMDGTAVVPATVNDTTKGTFTGWYDEEANDLAFTINYKKDTTVFKKDTLVTIYLYKEKPAAAGAVAARSFAFTVNIDATTKPTPTNISAALNFGVGGSKQLTAAEKSSFLAGQWYAVLVSKKFPNGVMGGQLQVTKQP